MTGRYNLFEGQERVVILTTEANRTDDYRVLIGHIGIKVFHNLVHILNIAFVIVYFIYTNKLAARQETHG